GLAASSHRLDTCALAPGIKWLGPDTSHANIGPMAITAKSHIPMTDINVATASRGTRMKAGAARRMSGPPNMPNPTTVPTSVIRPSRTVTFAPGNHAAWLIHLGACLGRNAEWKLPDLHCGRVPGA